MLIFQVSILLCLHWFEEFQSEMSHGLDTK